jgi:hypothetical protein
VGGPVIGQRPTAAEATAAILQRAAQVGLPLMIPGAWERRVQGQAAVAANAAGPATSGAHAATYGDRQRREYEREGGGAPGARVAAGQRTILARLRRLSQSLIRPAAPDQASSGRAASGRSGVLDPTSRRMTLER